MNQHFFSVFKLFLLGTFLIGSSFSSLKAFDAVADIQAALGESQQVMPVDDAFISTAEIVDGQILVRFDIEPNFYMYRPRFAFSADGATLGEPWLPEGLKKDDPYLGLTEVYYTVAEAQIPFTLNSPEQSSFEFTVEFQGCEENKICYPPTQRSYTLYLDSSEAPAALEHSNPIINFLKYVLLGLALTFTPCVLPMVPIISGIIAGQGEHATTKRSFLLALSYTQAMAIVYAILGVLVALAGQSLAGYFQTPAFIIATAVILIVLALSMFGFYELQLPASWQERLSKTSNNQQSGSLIGSGIMGALSALIVSPCVTAPLISVLLFISQTGDIVVGATSLYALALGMGIPLILVAVGGSQFLPKTGAWMNAVKAGFGVAMLGVALYISKHLIADSLYMYAWALLIMVPAWFMLKSSAASTSTRTFIQALGLIGLIYGALLIVGGAQGNRDFLQPIASSHTAELRPSSNDTVLDNAASDSTIQTAKKAHSLPFVRIKTVADLERALAEAQQNQQVVMLDFFAEWCVACYEFEDFVFSDPHVQSLLEGTVLLQADVTDNDEQDVELMQQLTILGLPSILFFTPTGQELTRLRAAGYEDAEAFAQRLQQVLAHP